MLNCVQVQVLSPAPLERSSTFVGSLLLYSSLLKLQMKGLSKNLITHLKNNFSDRCLPI